MQSQMPAGLKSTPHMAWMDIHSLLIFGRTTGWILKATQETRASQEMQCLYHFSWTVLSHMPYDGWWQCLHTWKAFLSKLGWLEETRLQCDITIFYYINRENKSGITAADQFFLMQLLDHTLPTECICSLFCFVFQVKRWY